MLTGVEAGLGSMFTWVEYEVEARIIREYRREFPVPIWELWKRSGKRSLLFRSYYHHFRFFVFIFSAKTVYVRFIWDTVPFGTGFSGPFSSLTS